MVVEKDEEVVKYMVLASPWVHVTNVIGIQALPLNAVFVCV